MIVQLGSTTKKRNSTLIPTLSRSVNCVLKDGCSIINPVLIFERRNVGKSYNYVYISDFGRYYFVDDIVYDGAQIIYSCSCDVLASFKEEIGIHQHYVTRSASKKNEYVIDNYYPVTTEVVTEYEQLSKPWLHYSGSNGIYVLGILGCGTGLRYYGFNQYQFESLLSYLMSDQYAADALGAFAVAANPQLKLLVDPIQYITGCVWIPVSPSDLSLTTVNNVAVGPVTTVYQAYDVSGGSMTYGVVNDATIPKHDHPQASVRGKYLNSSQFTEVQLYCPPFGMFPLDGVMLGMGTTVVNIGISLNTGLAHLTVVNDIGGEKNRMVDVYGQIGIPIPISTVITPGTNIVDVGTKIAGAVMNYMSGNYVGAVAGGASAIDSYAAGKVPRASVVGTMGTSLGTNAYASAEWTWKLVADDDNAKNGRPLCEDIQISSLSGYILCQAESVQISGTNQEADQVLRYLNTGFFYE